MRILIIIYNLMNQKRIDIHRLQFLLCHIRLQIGKLVMKINVF